MFGGLGSGMVEGLCDWESIASALLADDPESIRHPRARTFRAFADQTKSDRQALAACIAASRTLLGEAEMNRIVHPTLVAVGTKDDIAGSPDQLARMMPDAESFAIEGRDHMLSVGDRSFKARVIEFLREHPV